MFSRKLSNFKIINACWSLNDYLEMLYYLLVIIIYSSIIFYDEHGIDDTAFCDLNCKLFIFYLFTN